LNPGSTVNVPGMDTQPIAPNHHHDFKEFAGLFGLVAGLTMIPGRGPVSRFAADTVNVQPVDHVLDIGSGPGAGAREAARRGARVTGVEPAAVMRKLARFLTHGSRSIDWIDGTAEALPLEDAAATIVWSLSTVHHWRDVDAGLAESVRVLAPGGRFLAIERRAKEGARGLGSHGWTDAQAHAFAEMCSSHGFSGVKVQTASPSRDALLVVTARKV
jgi:ubiquinone/menaquinone biosynthesis C-methylase UbiE